MTAQLLDHQAVPAMADVDTLSRALEDIAARAMTLPERLRAAADQPGPAGAADVVKRRLDVWQDAAGAGDAAAFSRRLAWDDMDLASVRPALGPAGACPDSPRPAWLPTLQEALREASVPSPRSAAGNRDADGRLPFEEILAAFVEVAVRRVTTSAGPGWSRLTEQARADLRRPLLQVLCTYASQTLQLEFSVWRTRRSSGISRLFTSAVGGSTELYDAFIAQLRLGGLLELFGEYAVLARLLSTVTDLWAEATSELLDRLVADWGDVEAQLGHGRPLGPVTTLSASESDPHRGRRSVVAMTFASGCRVVYKPKDLGVEVAFDRLLGWLGARSAPASFGRTDLVVRDGYGWVGFVDHVPCTTGAQTRRYYRSSGALLCVLSLLGATDCHYENIIAAGEHPVIVDLETLLHPELVDDLDVRTEAERRAQDELSRSVLATGMLPVWQIDVDRASAYDVSGLGAVAEQITPFESAVWSQVGSDRMSLSFGRTPVRAGANLPFLSSSDTGPALHRREILDGFRAMYRFFLAHRAALLGSDGPLEGFAGLTVRVVLRNTSLYGRLHQQLMAPHHLREGVDRSIGLEVLCRLFLGSEQRPRLWPIVAAEQLAMERPDVPVFTACTDRDALVLESGEHVPGCFRGPSHAGMLSRAASLSEQDLGRQLSFIEGSLFAQVAREERSSTSSTRRPVTCAGSRQRAGAANPNTADALTGRAVELLDELWQHAVRGRDGSAVWIAPQYLVKVGRYQFQATGHDLYGGGAGIGLALAAAAHVTGESRLRRFAHEALLPVRTALHADPATAARRLGLGAATGLGGIVYALARAAELLDDPSLVDEAAGAARLVTPEAIAAEPTFDVVSGSAGAILGLLALDRLRPDPEALDLALTSGEHLLRTRRETAGGARSWPSQDRFLTGMSHGGAGIAFALLRLAARSGEPRFAEAAAEAIEYERSVFVPSAGNWTDLRPEAEHQNTTEPSCSTRWCHGAPGIVLARLGGLAALDTPQVRSDITIGLETTRHHGLERLDHLCCGNLGRVEVLLTAGRQLGRDDLVRDAQTQLARGRGRGGRGEPGLPPAPAHRPRVHPGAVPGQRRCRVRPAAGCAPGPPVVGADMGMMQLRRIPDRPTTVASRSIRGPPPAGIDRSATTARQHRQPMTTTASGHQPVTQALKPHEGDHS